MKLGSPLMQKLLFGPIRVQVVLEVVCEAHVLVASVSEFSQKVVFNPLQQPWPFTYLCPGVDGRHHRQQCWQFDLFARSLEHAPKVTDQNFIIEIWTEA